MNKGQKHTSLPWHCTKTKPSIIVNEGGDTWVARTFVDGNKKKSPRFHGSTETAWADAAFIVRACNAHYDLVEALEMWLSPYKGWSLDQLQKRCDPATLDRYMRTVAVLEKLRGSS